MEADLRELPRMRVARHEVLCDDDVRACNTADDPDRVAPRPGSGAVLDGARLELTLPPVSWSVLLLSEEAVKEPA